MILIKDNNGAYAFNPSQVQNIWQDGEFLKIWLDNGVVLSVTAPIKRVADLMVEDVYHQQEVSYKVDELSISF